MTWASHRRTNTTRSYFCDISKIDWETWIVEWWLPESRVEHGGVEVGEWGIVVPQVYSLSYARWISSRQLLCCDLEFTVKTVKVMVVFLVINDYWYILCCCWCCVTSVVSDSVWPQRWQPTRLPHPWDSPGKNAGVGCHCLLQYMKVKSESEVTQLCPTLCDPMDCSVPGSSIHGIFQARVLESVAIAFSMQYI